jgi:hypothetical protein
LVSAALVVEREEEGHALKVQRPVYFIREVLADIKDKTECITICMPGSSSIHTYSDFISE